MNDEQLTKAKGLPQDPELRKIIQHAQHIIDLCLQQPPTDIQCSMAREIIYLVDIAITKWGFGEDPVGG